MHTIPARLSITPPNEHRTNQEPSSLSTVCSEPIGHSRVSSTNTDNSEPGRITMQTRIAVRDTTPHRFHIIPLREAKNNCNLEEPIQQWSKLSETSTRSSDTNSTYNLPILRPPQRRQALSPPASSLIPISGKTLDKAHTTSSNKGKNGNNNRIEHTLLSSSTSTRALHNGDRGCLLITPLNTPSCQVNGLTHISNMGSSKAHKKGAYSEILSQNPLNDGLACQGTPRKVKARTFSEDLTRCNGQPLQGCAHSLSKLDELTWCPNKRHAIYADSMVLPFFNNKNNISESALAQNLYYPTSHPLQIDHSSCHHRHAQIRYSGDISDWPPGRNLTGVSAEMAFGLGPRATPLKQLSEEPRLPVNYLGLLPVARLRLPRKSRDPTDTRSSIISTLSAVHENPIKHSKAIGNLLSQLDEAIREWDSLKRLFAQRPT